MIVKLLTEQHLEFLSLKGGYRGSSKSTFVKNVKIVENLMPRLKYLKVRITDIREGACGGSFRVPEKRRGNMCFVLYHSLVPVYNYTIIQMI